MGSETNQSDIAGISHNLPEEILVQAWSSRYAIAVTDLLKTEVGFVDDKVDRGGTTKYGISLRFLVSEGKIDLDDDGRADFDLDGDGDIDGFDIRKLTRGDAKFLYHHCFWKRMDCDNLPRPVGEMMFDQGVNAGIGSARRLLQLAINRCLTRAASAPPQLKVDGAIRKQTLDAMNWVLRWGALGMPALTDAFRVEVRLRYRAIAERHPSQKKFLRGWLARADRLGRI
jgi:lysozyme family protein